MRTIIIFFVILIWGFQTASLSQECITPQQLGLKLKKGQIDKNKMSSGQNDTIAIGLFNYEDYLYDIAVAFKTQYKIKIYRNSSNGSLSEYRTIELSKEINKLELDQPDMFLCPSARCGLKIFYKDNTVQALSPKEINNISGNILSKAPLRNIFDDSRLFVYDISFIEQWRSERNGQPHNWVTLGDIDRDGKNEAIYTFYNDTSFYFTRIVVFENVSQNQYRIDWDTLLVFGGYNEMSKITDFDDDGDYEFMGVSMAPWNQLVHGLFECYGQGRYKFRFAGYNEPRTLFSVQLKDSVTVNGITKPGLWVCYSNLSSDDSWIIKLRFNIKTSAGFAFNPISFIEYPGFVYSISADDIDKDGQDEVILGETQFGTNLVGYLDSTGGGVPQGQGYEYKVITPNAPLSVGESFEKDYDGDGYKELTVCGIGDGTGSIGVIKHTGAPSSNQFNTVWWDSAGILAAPNMGIDTGYIDNKFSVLYPTYRFNGNFDVLHLLNFTKGSTYNFYKSSYQIIDSAAFLNGKFIDIDNNNKLNILAPSANGGVVNGFWTNLRDFEQVGTIGIQILGNTIPKDFILHQNYPNPFNPETKIKFEILKAAYIEIKIFDINGSEVQSLIKQKLSTGVFSINFDGNNFSSGVYFYSFFVDGQNIDSKKMILIK